MFTFCLYPAAPLSVGLGLFNLLPIPPLDGFHVVNDILLGGRLQLNYRLHQITHAILMVLMLSGILNRVLSFCVTNVYEVVLRLSLMLKC